MLAQKRKRDDEEEEEKREPARELRVSVGEAWAIAKRRLPALVSGAALLLCAADVLAELSLAVRTLTDRAPGAGTRSALALSLSLCSYVFVLNVSF